MELAEIIEYTIESLETDIKHAYDELWGRRELTNIHRNDFVRIAKYPRIP